MDLVLPDAEVRQEGHDGVGVERLDRLFLRGVAGGPVFVTGSSAKGSGHHGMERVLLLKARDRLGRIGRPDEGLAELALAGRSHGKDRKTTATATGAGSGRVFLVLLGGHWNDAAREGEGQGLLSLFDQQQFLNNVMVVGGRKTKTLLYEHTSCDGENCANSKSSTTLNP